MRNRALVPVLSVLIAGAMPMATLAQAPRPMRFYVADGEGKNVGYFPNDEASAHDFRNSKSVPFGVVAEVTLKHVQFLMLFGPDNTIRSNIPRSLDAFDIVGLYFEGVKCGGRAWVGGENADYIGRKKTPVVVLEPDSTVYVVMPGIEMQTARVNSYLEVPVGKNARCVAFEKTTDAFPATGLGRLHDQFPPPYWVRSE